MPETSARISKPKPEGSTRIGTRGTILEGVDMRTHGGRRFKELAADLFEHVGGNPTAPQVAIIRRAAAIAAWCEAQEAAQASGGDFDIAAYGAAANTLRRLLSDLGYQPPQRDVTTLSEYLRAKAEGAA